MCDSPRLSAATTSSTHVDEEDAAAGLGERGRKRHADVTGADDRDVVVALSHGRQG